MDLAGPLFTREGAKVWIVIFTCAIYRAVHLDRNGSSLHYMPDEKVVKDHQLLGDDCRGFILVMLQQVTGLE
ncbi:hypothetical protein JTE90_021727 [Oedothorax gibbosus]|uniref:Uncharacterized protein n=1 Tax=Oedothorax gibbosus TaxID=931172 RepID=A0AAV6UFR0_9ARAC|nr:hypothetical protein JTE90_021727 [Oedothorax gibbosus]